MIYDCFHHLLLYGSVYSHGRHGLSQKPKRSRCFSPMWFGQAFKESSAKRRSKASWWTTAIITSWRGIFFPEKCPSVGRMLIPGIGGTTQQTTQTTHFGWSFLPPSPPSQKNGERIVLGHLCYILDCCDFILLFNPFSSPLLIFQRLRLVIFLC